MTGFYLRMVIEGKPVTVELDRLNDKDLNDFAGRLEEDELRRWLIAVVQWVRDHVHEAPAGRPEGERT